MHHSSTVIRTARVDDARSIAHVQVETWRTAYRGVIAADFLKRFSVDEREERWAEILQQPDQIVFVIEAGDAEVIGFASGGRERTRRTDFCGELYGLYVLPAYHGSGKGRALVSSIAHRLLQLEFTTMLVWTLRNNPYRGFYEHIGGQLVTERQITLGSQTLDEVAYGWTNLDVLAGPNRSRQ